MIDARGLACPQPVILTRRAMRTAAGETIVVVVDNDSACQNVTRMAEREGYSVATDAGTEETRLTLTPRAPAAAAGALSVPTRAASSAPDGAGPVVLLVASDEIGKGDTPELGRILMHSFLHALGEVEPVPTVALFLNGGVRLVVEGSPALEDLRALQERGMRIAACGTCLDYHGLKDRLAIGEVSNMYSIAETLLGAARVVRL